MSEEDGLGLMYQLRLFVAGNTARSRRAIDNLRRLCDEHLNGQANVQIIDIYQQPELAEKYQTVAAPTLVKLLPLPIRHVIGDLSEEARVLRGLEIMASPLSPIPSARPEDRIA